MAATAARPLRVLIIDDEPDIVEALRMRFRKEGTFAVETALSAEDGLTKVKPFHPDVILLDLVMPGTDGWEVHRRLALDAATKDIPIVIMTAQDGAADEQRAKDAGIRAILVKPFDLGLLVDTLRTALPQ